MIDGTLSLAAPLSTTLADKGDWGNYVYLGFFVLAGLASALGKLFKRGHDKKDTDAADSEAELEAETLPKPAAARKVERPPPSVMTSPLQPPAARPATPPHASLPAPPAVLPTMKSVPAPPPIQPLTGNVLSRVEPAQPAPRKPRRLTQAAQQAKAAYEQQVETARPRAPLGTDQPVAPQRSNVAPDVRVLRRLLADRTGQRAAIALCEVLGPPIALRDSHLER